MEESPLQGIGAALDAILRFYMDLIRLLAGKPNAMRLDATPPLTQAELAQTENDSDYKADTGTYQTDAALNSAFAARLWAFPETPTELPGLD